MPATPTTTQTERPWLDPATQDEALRLRAEGLSYPRIAASLGFGSAQRANDACFTARRRRGLVLRAGDRHLCSQSRSFGVEIEADHLGITRAAQAMAAAGFMVEEYPSWVPHGPARGHDRQTWKVGYDGSVPGGSETATPPLVGEAGLASVAEAMKVLRAEGGEATSVTGLHVHVDASDLTSGELATLARFWWSVQWAAFGLVSVSRRGGTWCGAVSAYERDTIVQKARDGEIRVGGHHVLGTRYKSLNFEAYLKYGTVEFRLHQGTLNGRKTAAWVAFCLAIVETARHRRQAIDIAAAVEAAAPALRTKALIDALESAGRLCPADAEYLRTRSAGLN
jgi:Putative amidoligase enzyme